MPYTGPGDKSLPSNVQELPEDKRETWVAIFNDALKRCQDDGGEDCEASAFAQANGVVMGEADDWAALAQEVLAEAATLKSKAQALLRDMASLLEERTLPESVRKEIEDVRTALRRTWADLEADGVEKAEEADMPEDELITETLGESAEGVELLSEGAALEDGQGPLTLKVKLIEPGFGNKRDGHYYPADILKRDAHVFEGAKMYETDHKDAEKSTRTWVSTVRKVVGFSDTGAPLAEVVVHDPSFARRVRNLAQSEMLGAMACSILASGNVKRGAIGGQQAKIVEAITDAQSVDWVTRAGAGGQALAIMSEAQGSADAPRTEPDTVIGGNDMVEDIKQEPAPTEEPVQLATVVAEAEPQPEPVVERLSEADVTAILAEAQANEAIKERLAHGEYKDADALKAAVAAEVEYVKKATGAGRVTDMGEGAAAKPKTVTLAEVEDRVRKVNERWGFGPKRQPEKVEAK